MKYYFLFFTLLLLGNQMAAQDKLVTFYQDGASDPPELAITLMHIRAEISFQPEKNLVIGKTEFTFSPNRDQTDSILFSTPDFTIKSVYFEFAGSKIKGQGSTKADWHRTGTNLVIVPPKNQLKYHQENKITIEYEALPLRGSIYFTGWKPEEEGKRKEIWAHRPNGWLPYLDARVTMDMFYTFDENYKVFANGERIEVKSNPDKTRTWHYRMTKNHPFFSTSVVIGKYDYKSTTSEGGVPLEYWYYTGDEAKVEPTYQFTTRMMDFFEKELDFKYPYPVYRQAPVIDYMYGAMETTTATVFGDFMLIDPHAYWQRNYINTNAHEMAHQWFGNYICQFVNKDVWLTESFGTYYAKMFEKSVFGEDYYQNSMNDELNTTLAAAKTNQYPVGSSMGGVARIYQKGSLVLGMLRSVMGEKEFCFAVKKYLTEHPYRNALQEDFFRDVYEASGKSYQWFFDEWILHGGEPNYKVTWLVRDDTLGNRATCIQVGQIHETNALVGLFKMPINIEVYYKDGTFASACPLIENKFHEIMIPNQEKKPISYLLFDPGRKVLKKVSFEKSFEELSSQALKAKNMIDRYDALVALRMMPVKDKRTLLLSCYSNEKYQLTRSEIIDQLSDDRMDASLELFKNALKDEDALVRKAVLRSVSPVPQSLKADFEEALNDFSYLNQELALQNLCLSFPENVSAYLEKTKAMKGWRGLNIRMKWLEIAISKGDRQYLPELIDYSGPEFEFETRINAMNVLKRLLYIDSTTAKNASQASLHWNNKLATAGKDYLKYFNHE